MEKKAKEKGKIVNVVVRVRPILQEDWISDATGKHNVICVVEEDEKTLILSKESVPSREFKFASISHYKKVNQENFFSRHCEEQIQDVFKGKNITFITIGQVRDLLRINKRLVLERLIQCSEVKQRWIQWKIKIFQLTLVLSREAYSHFLIIFKM